MATMGFTDDEQHNTFTLIAFMMHLSRVDFERGDSGDDSRISSASIEAATSAASLIGIRMGEFEAGLCKKTYMDPQNKRTIDIPVGVGPAHVSRDALAKMVYELLFLWLVKRINDAINVTPPNDGTAKRRSADAAEASFIGVLDIFGFETFNINTFEQLCVNYANEKLQQQFNESMFKVQQEEYREERIRGEGVADFPDNSHCISLIEGTGKLKPGIIGTLSAACAPFTRGEAPRKGADGSFAEKLYKHFEGKSDCFVANNSMKGWKKFGVVHYAGLVEYNTEGFIRKNMDLLSSRCRDMIQTATLPIIGAMFATEEGRRADAARRSSLMGSSSSSSFSSSKKGYGGSPKRSRRGSKAGGRGSLKQVTIAEGFRRQLNSLMATIFETTSWYVRCIKPNDDNVPDRLDEPRLLEQLRYGGVLEAVRVTREGYPCRVKHDEFVTKFSSMRSSAGAATTATNKSKSTVADECRMILEAAGLMDEAQCQVGLTKVFMRQECYDFIEAWRWKRMNDAAVRVQAHQRGAIQRQQYRRWRLVLVKVVIRIRLWLKARRKCKARECWARAVMSRVLLKWRERRLVWAAKRTIYACWKRRQVEANVNTREIARRKQAKEDAMLENQLKRAKEELVRAHERIAHLEQAGKASAAAAAMAAATMPLAPLPADAVPMNLDVSAKHEELYAMNEKLLRERAALARAHERIAHLEQAGEASAAAAAMAAATMPLASLPAYAVPLNLGFVNKHEELRAMNEKLLHEQAALHKLVAGKVEVNAQLAMYITELADELEEVTLFRDALLMGDGDEDELGEKGTMGRRSPSPSRPSPKKREAQVPIETKKKKTLYGKVTELAEQLGVDNSLPLVKKVAAANEAMGIEPIGSMVQQVDALVAQLGI